MAALRISTTRLLLVLSRLSWILSVLAAPLLNSIKRGPLPEVLSGLYQRQTEKNGPNVMDGTVKN